MGFFKKLFSTHHAIESFGVLFVVLVVGLVGVTGSIFIRKAAYDHDLKENTAIYTTGFVMSKTKAEGKISGLFTDKAHTKAFLLCSFADMSMLPTKAENYSIVMAGSKDNGEYAPLKSNPTGSIYVFGSTGLIGIYLEDENGFPSQLTQILLQSNVNLTGRSSDNSYDSALIYFNPGGSNAANAAFLEKSDWTMFDMVEETITRNDEIKIRNQLSSYLSDMVKQQTLMTEYSNRLTDLGVEVPSVPAEINDRIYAIADKQPEAGELHYITGYGGGWVNDAENVGYKDEDVTLYLDSNYTFSNGFDFNWQDGRILTGYLEQLSGSSSLTAWDKYITRRTGAEDDNSFEDTLRSINWKYKDGTSIVVSNDDSSRTSNDNKTQRDTEINKAINLLQDAWETYYTDKKAYETEALPALLNLEFTGRSSLTMYDINDSSNVLTIVKE